MMISQLMSKAWACLKKRGRTCLGECDYYDILHKELEHACILLSAGGFETNNPQLQNNYILTVEGDIEIQCTHQQVNSRHTILVT